MEQEKKCFRSKGGRPQKAIKRNQSRWFNATTARYVGMAKTHTQHLMEAIAYNLYRSPNIIAKHALLIN